ncbi:hypothetical protein [Sporomusa sp.]|uniref:hypothetical protein n=1 Tax=Sporomusa sp. TaxID=2078658 RepID=UPI002C30691C|nr:hypothetical protein [Sporomusa sp.]HWR44876.1 hypothetical protein [Sporomusa sp.]
MQDEKSLYKLYMVGCATAIFLVSILALAGCSKQANALAVSKIDSKTIVLGIETDIMMALFF